MFQHTTGNLTRSCNIKSCILTYLSILCKHLFWRLGCLGDREVGKVFKVLALIMLTNDSLWLDKLVSVWTPTRKLCFLYTVICFLYRTLRCLSSQTDCPFSLLSDHSVSWFTFFSWHTFVKVTCAQLHSLKHHYEAMRLWVINLFSDIEKFSRFPYRKALW